MLEMALDTLTSTPPSSDDEDADKLSKNNFNVLPCRSLACFEVLGKVDETNSVKTTKNTKKIEKADQITYHILIKKIKT